MGGSIAWQNITTPSDTFMGSPNAQVKAQGGIPISQTQTLPTYTAKQDTSQQSVPQYIPGTAFSYGNLPMQLTPYAAALLQQIQQGATQTTPQTTPQTVPGDDLMAKLAAARANRPEVKPVTLPTQGLNSTYANVRPDMLIDPEAAGWYKAPSAAFGFGRIGRLFGTTNSELKNASQTYTDPDGNIWYRK